MTLPDKEAPFHWGDETEPEAEQTSKEDGKSYTSVAELLEAEDEAEKKRLEEYFREKDEREISK